MKRRMADVLANALGGRIVADDVRTGEFSVEISQTFIRRFRGPIGRMIERGETRTIRIDEDSAASYGPLRDDPEGDVEAVEWDDWGDEEEWARELAHILGAESIHTGGNIWNVKVRRPDGRIVIIGDAGCEIWESDEHYEGYYNGDWPEPEGKIWD